jgi:murein DD-endopeptidase MepM/ murein hydrolase activator NlpD
MRSRRTLLLGALGLLATGLAWLLVVLPASSLAPSVASGAAATSPDDRAQQQAASATTASAARESAARDAYGLPKQGYTTTTHRIRRNETFADLLVNRGVAYETIVETAEATRSVFDVRDMRTGKEVRLYRDPWLQQVRYVVYPIDPVNYVVYDVLDPETSYRGQRAVDTRWKTVGGTINSSLYETLMDAGAHPELALQLSEVFAWQIDFFRIRKGDRFRVVYKEQRVDGERVAPGTIIAAHVRHLDEDFYGFRFDDGEGPAEYYNREGGSLRRQLLKAPLRYNRISSRFTNRRFHPVLKRYRPHHGTDYAAPRGTPVHSVGAGEVLFAGYKKYNGYYVKVRHNATYSSGYLHLSDIADGVEPGTRVEQGETIGYVGSTGLSTGPHLDYRLWKFGEAIDPYTIDLPPAEPVDPAYQAEYQQHVDRLLTYLDLPPFQAEVALSRRVPSLSPSAAMSSTEEAPVLPDGLPSATSLLQETG